MKRYVCTVATGLLLALVSTGTATASLLPLPGVPGTQEMNFLPLPDQPGKEEDEKGSGGQSVDQENDADVTNEQTNKNILSPPIAIAVLGHAEASNEQSNRAETDIQQENEAKQDSSSSGSGGYGCCNGQSQAGEQDVEQENDADVTDEQTNVNFLSPPVALGILGKAEAENEQSNVSKTEIEQENEAKQESEPKQYGGKPCSSSCQPKKDYGRKPGCSSKCEPQREYGRESSSGGQSVRQENDADVTDEQTNVNFLSPPVALGILGKAEAENEQENEAKQKQAAYQRRSVVDRCKGLIYR